MTIEITLDEIINGATREVMYQRQVRDGNVEQLKLNIPIRVGESEETTYRSMGAGNYPPAHKSPYRTRDIPGDLIVHFKVKPHKHFKIQGKDVYYTLELPFDKMVFGTELHIPTINEQTKTSLKIPAGTKSGKKFRFKGMGVPFLQETKDNYGISNYNSVQGDYYVVVQTYIPTDLTDSQKEILRELSEKDVFKKPEI